MKKGEYLVACGIKLGWHQKSLEDFDNDTVALDKVKKYITKVKDFRSLGVGLYLWGSNGTGKSHLMNCAFIELLDQKQKVRIFTLDEIVDKFTSSWSSSEEKMLLQTMLREVDFLGIDEFGKNVNEQGKPTQLPELVKRIMESVIRYRVQSKKPMWFTSNTDPKFVSEVFSPDIASLLREAVIPVPVQGSDYRAKLQAKYKKML